LTWTTFHEESAKLADAARVARWRGDAESAQANSLAAARAELAALGELGAEDPETYGVIAVSAAALFYKGKALDEAEKVAREALSASYLPAYARSQLKEIIWAVRWERLNPRNIARRTNRWFVEKPFMDRVIISIDVGYVCAVALFFLLMIYNFLNIMGKMPGESFEFDGRVMIALSALLVALNGFRLSKK